jgi:AraC-like DNA-binding protein
LKRAAQLLKESGLSVTEIAYQVGFKDPSSFLANFLKKQFGKSPKEYYKRIRRNHPLVST